MLHGHLLRGVGCTYRFLGVGAASVMEALNRKGGGMGADNVNTEAPQPVAQRVPELVQAAGGVAVYHGEGSLFDVAQAQCILEAGGGECPPELRSLGAAAGGDWTEDWWLCVPSDMPPQLQPLFAPRPQLKAAWAGQRGRLLSTTQEQKEKQASKATVTNEAHKAAAAARPQPIFRLAAIKRLLTLPLSW